MVNDDSVINIVYNRHQSSHSYVFVFAELLTDSRCSVVVSGNRARANVPVFLGITLIDSFTNEHSWPKIVQKQSEITLLIVPRKLNILC